MTKDEIKEVFEAMSERKKETQARNTPMIAILIGLSIAVGGNFIGWFATKSSSDIANVTRINQTLEFMQLQNTSENEALKTNIAELKKTLEGSIVKIELRLDKQFTREDFNREMIYRDQDMKRMQNQVETIFDKIEQTPKKSR